MASRLHPAWDAKVLLLHSIVEVVIIPEWVIELATAMDLKIVIVNAHIAILRISERIIIDNLIGVSIKTYKESSALEYCFYD